MAARESSRPLSERAGGSLPSIIFMVDSASTLTWRLPVSNKVPSTQTVTPFCSTLKYLNYTGLSICGDLGVDARLKSQSSKLLPSEKRYCVPVRRLRNPADVPGAKASQQCYRCNHYRPFGDSSDTFCDHE